MNDWQKRFCVLENGIFNIYHNSGDEVPSKIIDLSTVS